jgi:hypothetical protein
MILEGYAHAPKLMYFQGLQLKLTPMSNAVPLYLFLETNYFPYTDAFNIPNLPDQIKVLALKSFDIVKSHNLSSTNDRS